jgi:hypothetical protein
MPRCPGPVQQQPPAPPPADVHDDDDEECSVCGRLVNSMNENCAACWGCHNLVCEDCWDTGCCRGPMTGEVTDRRRQIEYYSEDHDDDG